MSTDKVTKIIGIEFEPKRNREIIEEVRVRSLLRLRIHAKYTSLAAYAEQFKKESGEVGVTTAYINKFLGITGGFPIPKSVLDEFGFELVETKVYLGRQTQREKIEAT